MAKLKDKVAEFAAIAGDLPENLQVVCFELLLKNHLQPPGTQTHKAREVKDTNDNAGGTDGDTTKTVDEVVNSQEDIAPRDLHLKVKKFLDKYSLSLEQLNNVYYKEGEKILPLYEDLNTTKMSEGQIRIALLQSLGNAINSGKFEASVEEVRAECVDRKCYSSNNYTNNFRNNDAYFDFDEFDRDTKSVRLAEDGRKVLAEVIKELQ